MMVACTRMRVVEIERNEFKKCFGGTIKGLDNKLDMGGRGKRENKE